MGFSEDGELVEKIGRLVIKQLENYWDDFDKNVIMRCVKPAMKKIEECFKDSNSMYVRDGDEVLFSPVHSVTWTLFLYRLSREIRLEKLREQNKAKDIQAESKMDRIIADHKSGGVYQEADCIYYLNKIMNGVEWYHVVDLPIHFMAEHPIGSVIGRAEFGDYFTIFQRVTVGGNGFDEYGMPYYPKIGNNCVMYSDAKILGKCNIGNNVIVSASTYIKDEDIPDNCIVFGISPNLIIKVRSKEEMKKRTEFFWKNSF